MRGFILSLVAILFLAFLFFAATSLHTHHLTMERMLLFPQPLSYGAFVHDQAAYELNRIIGPDIYMDSSNTSFNLTIRQDIPAENMSNLLEDYEELLEQDLADEIHANIDANLTNIYDGDHEMTIAGLYSYSTDMDGTMLFNAISGDTGVLYYELNVTIPEERTNLIRMSEDPSGINVTINYVDLNGTVLEEKTVNPSAANRFIVDYNGSSLEIGVGRESGNDGSLWILATNLTAQVTWSAVLPPLNESDKAGFQYDAWMNYSSGPYSVNRQIGT